METNQGDNQMKYLIAALAIVVAYFLPAVLPMATFAVLGVEFNPSANIASMLAVLGFGLSFVVAVSAAQFLDIIDKI